MAKLSEIIEKITDKLLTSDGMTVAEAREANENRTDKKQKLLSTRPRACLENVKIVLEKDPRFKDRLVYNDIDLKLYKLKAFPWDDESTLTELPGLYGQMGLYLYNDKRDGAEIKRLIQRDYFQNLAEIDAEVICEGIRHTVNPVKTLLENLEWDGKEHIRYLLPTYLGVENDEYQKKALTLIMLTLITRLYAPGTKMDCVLALTGDQGIGKSSFCQKLAFNDLSLFTDRLGDLTNKDTLQMVAGKLVIELGEMLACKKTKEIEAVKSFLSAQQDTFRAPYDRTYEDHLRRCILISTTNEREFLSDITGDRRWIVCECRKDHIQKDINFDADSMSEILQAWAEAYHIYSTEHPDLVRLSYELAPEAKIHAEMHKEQDPKIGMIGEYLDRIRRSETKPRVCAVMIQREALGEYDANKWSTKDISKIMDFEFTEWTRAEKRQRCGQYGLQTVWQTEPISGIGSDTEPEPEDDTDELNDQIEQIGL